MKNEDSVRTLYLKLIQAWNDRNAEQMSSCFETNGEMIGFDGTCISGRQLIFEHLDEIFAHHSTPPFTCIIKNIRFLQSEIAVLRAIAGMVPEGESKLNPELNAVQTLVAIQKEGKWEVAHFQNTPAQFHGRPELVEQMTTELEKQRMEKSAY
ncbi:SgcJ/EcaC family oxidoreductase [Shimazuella sp. AN120528]|uniref:SgcJ/EcaC family oxidoreductase n=1 Tax=Shimazuella soli TaxID=1892854 RepID=UPI001F0CFE0E|nr:SgcJ/EcaC family oxidoreductase [Shimazuella soli]MCH5585432.1 SgcJ/EcaC family oxidoreductase [Shimazuella soli]